MILWPKRVGRLPTPVKRQSSGRSAMAEVKSETAFGRAAVAFDIHEADYYVLLHNRINNFETLAFRFPVAADFEDFLRRVVRVSAGYRDDQGVVQVHPRPSPMPWEDYRHEEDVGCLRKLWTLASKASQKAMERLAGDDPESKTKVTLTRAQELEDKGIDLGMPAPTSDKERPSLHTLTKVQGTFGPGGSFQHLSWESYVSMEVENKLRRAGKLPKDKQEIYVEGDKFGIMPKEEGVIGEAVKVSDILTLQDVLELRARAYHMLDVCPYKVVMDYSTKIIGHLRNSTPEGMRVPTLNEARKADREIFTEILKWVGKGKGSVEKGLTHYASTPDADLWKLMAQQIESSKGDDSRQKEERVKKRKDPEGESSAGPNRPSTAELPRLCLVCRKRHEPRCELTPEWRAEQKRKKKENKQKQREAKGKGKRSGGQKEADK